MPSKKEWRVSSDGPDVLDVMTMGKAIGVLHSADVAVIVGARSDGSDTGVHLTASAIFQRLPGSSLPESVTACADWPTRTGESLWGLAYRLMWELDENISKVYKQESLWK